MSGLEGIVHAYLPESPIDTFLKKKLSIEITLEGNNKEQLHRSAETYVSRRLMLGCSMEFPKISSISFFNHFGFTFNSFDELLEHSNVMFSPSMHSEILRPVIVK